MADYNLTGIKIDRNQLFAELSSAEPILVKAAKELITEKYFDPAVSAMKNDFNNDEITKELQGGTDSPNTTETLTSRATFNIPPIRKDGRVVNDASQPNLFNFIGFDEGTNPTIEIEQRLDPRHPDGPKLVYKGKDNKNLAFAFQVSTPNEDKIYEATPLPWAGGLSWSKRIEQGLPGIGFFLNRIMPGGMRGAGGSGSGGGIQVGRQLRGGSFTPRGYLTVIFRKFLDRFNTIKR